MAECSITNKRKMKNDESKLIRSHETENEEDHISKLPDEVIMNQILYRLTTSEEIIRTGILSKRWKNLWRSVPKLIFDDYMFRNPNFYGFPYYDDEHTDEFYKCVDETLSGCQLQALDEFKLEANYDNQFLHNVNKLVDFCCIRKVKRFSLDLRSASDDYRCLIYQHFFYINTHFTDIMLRCCVFDPNESITWNNLINLRIVNSEIDERLIRSILSGSPLLKSLTFEVCKASLLDINSNSVEELQLVCFSAIEKEDAVTIKAPNILSLKIVGKMFASDILLQDVSSLVRASLDYLIPRNIDTIHKRDQEEVLKGVIRSLEHVKDVAIGYSCHKVLCRLGHKGFIRPENLIGVLPLIIYYRDEYDSDLVDDTNDTDDTDMESSDDE